MLVLSLAALLTSTPALAQSFSGSGETVDQGSQGNTPDYYQVAPGDTLWDISRAFLGNPEFWPRLWSINDYITNPHWIYPGNRIAFRLGTDTEPPVVELEVATPEQYTPTGLSFEYAENQCGPDVRFTDTAPADIYQATGFLADGDDVDVYGEVYKAKTRQYWLSEGNLVYLKMDDPEAYDCGDVLTVFRRTEKQVRDPRKRSNKFGSAYVVVGEVRVVHRVEDIVAGVVRTSYIEMQRGDLVGPLMPVHVELVVDPPEGDLEGHIVGRPSDLAHLNTVGDNVFMNIGRADGARVGDSFYTVVQRDEAVDGDKEDDMLPEQVTGRIVVVRVDEYTSTGVITDASRHIEPGTRLVQTVDAE